MTRLRKDESTAVMDSAIAEAEKPKIEDMPLETMRHYRLYNEEARMLNKKAKKCLHPLKQCPVDLHPTERIVFSRNDQPSNPLAVYVSNDKIHFEKTLVPGKTYDLPKYIVSYLAEKGKAVWGWVEKPDGSSETKIVNKERRFSLKTVYSDYEDYE